MSYEYFHKLGFMLPVGINLRIFIPYYIMLATFYGQPGQLFVCKPVFNTHFNGYLQPFYRVAPVMLGGS